MNPEIQELIERCSAAQANGRTLLERQLQLIAARHRLRRHSVAVLEEFTGLARDFYDRVAARRASGHDD